MLVTDVGDQMCHQHNDVTIITVTQPMISGLLAICNKALNAIDFKSVSKEEALAQASVFL